MTKHMLIDATHAEETRVVVLEGNRLEDFDVETSTKKQLKGNIYLAKVVRVEPSLQAAFVEYGGGRHGFLAFGEIHPDYYQIPVADRQRLIELQAEAAREEEEEEEAADRIRETGAEHAQASVAVETVDEFADNEGYPADIGSDAADPAGEAVEPQSVAPFPPSEPVPTEQPVEEAAATVPGAVHSDASSEALGAEAGHVPAAHSSMLDGPATEAASGDEDKESRPAQAAAIPQDMRFGEVADVGEPPPGAEEVFAGDTEGFAPDPDGAPEDLPPPETIGGETDTYDGAAEARARRTSRLLRNYRIQEVIKRRQIMLVQVVKEERGTKGAALTTYISLAGRFSVLMPNSPRGGGISRKITSAADRRRLKEITSELEIPRGMGLIVRTAGANRPKPEIKRDCEYLMRLWDDIRELTLNSVAPALIYEEASLIKRAIRDGYSRDIEDVLVDGETGWRAAHDFMRMLMPAHARKVQLWRPDANGNGGQPLFSRFGVEAQLDAMLSPTVQLRSGGYLVIAQTEALVSIDVNSGRSTRERGIEETALKTNMEAADEVARQLRLRDLAGLIVIDFIDMESRKHNAMVERRLKDALKSDRARIQVGHISHFGLLEMSRQRLRPSLAETSFVACPHCGGLGHVRSVESSAIHILRAIEEEGGKRRASLIMVHCGPAVMMYLLNHKRERLAEIEARYVVRVHFTADDSLLGPNLRIDRLQPALREPERPVHAAVIPAPPAFEADDEDIEDEDEEEDEVEARGNGSTGEGQTGDAEDGERRRRRRRRRGGRRDPQIGTAVRDEESGLAGPLGVDEPPSVWMEPGGEATGAEPVDEPAAAVGEAGQPAVDPSDFDENGLPRSRGPRRSRRGGRRRGGRREDGSVAAAAPGDEEPVAEPAEAAPTYVATAYSGPTPADPFARHELDIFDLMDQVEQQRAAPPPPAPPHAPAADVPSLDIPPVPADATEPRPQDPLVETAPAEQATEPAPAPALAAAAPPAPESNAPAPEAAPPEPVIGPAIQPILIGADPTPATERKRGWWRR
ncbi:MAG TPA: Rne/Rng family ribonuclease [Acetobacteraceae bacterium]|nr:Rne/Rng family ribonuclease [Acetobacteraceae bacterium]